MVMEDGRKAAESARSSKSDSSTRYQSWWCDRHFFLLCALALPIWMMWHGLGWQTTKSAWLLLLVAPVLEEVVFRGALQGWFLGKSKERRLFGPVTLANALTSTAFAALHGLKQGGGLGWLTFFPSLIFGHCRERYGTLLPCIVLHAVYNAGIWL